MNIEQKQQRENLIRESLRINTHPEENNNNNGNPILYRINDATGVGKTTGNIFNAIDASHSTNHTNKKIVGVMSAVNKKQLEVDNPNLIKMADELDVLFVPVYSSGDLCSLKTQNFINQKHESKRDDLPFNMEWEKLGKKEFWNDCIFKPDNKSKENIRRTISTIKRYMKEYDDLVDTFIEDEKDDYYFNIDLVKIRNEIESLYTNLIRQVGNIYYANKEIKEDDECELYKDLYLSGKNGCKADEGIASIIRLFSPFEHARFFKTILFLTVDKQVTKTRLISFPKPEKEDATNKNKDKNKIVIGKHRVSALIGKKKTENIELFKRAAISMAAGNSKYESGKFNDLIHSIDASEYFSFDENSPFKNHRFFIIQDEEEAAVQRISENQKKRFTERDKKNDRLNIHAILSVAKRIVDISNSKSGSIEFPIEIKQIVESWERNFKALMIAGGENKDTMSAASLTAYLCGVIGDGMEFWVNKSDHENVDKILINSFGLNTHTLFNNIDGLKKIVIKQIDDHPSGIELIYRDNNDKGDITIYDLIILFLSLSKTLSNIDKTKDTNSGRWRGLFDTYSDSITHEYLPFSKLWSISYQNKDEVKAVVSSTTERNQRDYIDAIFNYMMPKLFVSLMPVKSYNPDVSYTKYSLSISMVVESPEIFISEMLVGTDNMMVIMSATSGKPDSVSTGLNKAFFTDYTKDNFKIEFKERTAEERKMIEEFGILRNELGDGFEPINICITNNNNSAQLRSVIKWANGSYVGGTPTWMHEATRRKIWQPETGRGVLKDIFSLFGLTYNSGSDTVSYGSSVHRANELCNLAQGMCFSWHQNGGMVDPNQESKMLGHHLMITRSHRAMKRIKGRIGNNKGDLTVSHWTGDADYDFNGSVILMEHKQMGDKKLRVILFDAKAQKHKDIHHAFNVSNINEIVILITSYKSGGIGLNMVLHNGTQNSYNEIDFPVMSIAANPYYSDIFGGDTDMERYIVAAKRAHLDHGGTYQKSIDLHDYTTRVGIEFEHDTKIINFIEQAIGRAERRSKLHELILFIPEDIIKIIGNYYAHMSNIKIEKYWDDIECHPHNPMISKYFKGAAKKELMIKSYCNRRVIEAALSEREANTFKTAEERLFFENQFKKSLDALRELNGPNGLIYRMIEIVRAGPNENYDLETIERMVNIVTCINEISFLNEIDISIKNVLQITAGLKWSGRRDLEQALNSILIRLNDKNIDLYHINIDGHNVLTDSIGYIEKGIKDYVRPFTHNWAVPEKPDNVDDRLVRVSDGGEPNVSVFYNLNERYSELVNGGNGRWVIHPEFLAKLAGNNGEALFDRITGNFNLLDIGSIYEINATNKSELFELFDRYSVSGNTLYCIDVKFWDTGRLRRGPKDISIVESCEDKLNIVSESLNRSDNTIYLDGLLYHIENIEAIYINTNTKSGRGNFYDNLEQGENHNVNTLNILLIEPVTWNQRSADKGDGDYSKVLVVNPKLKNIFKNNTGENNEQ